MESIRKTPDGEVAITGLNGKWYWKGNPEKIIQMSCKRKAWYVVLEAYTWPRFSPDLDVEFSSMSECQQAVRYFTMFMERIRESKKEDNR